MTRPAKVSLVINGWTVFAHPLFLAQLEATLRRFDGKIQLVFPGRTLQNDLRPLPYWRLK